MKVYKINIAAKLLNLHLSLNVLMIYLWFFFYVVSFRREVKKKKKEQRIYKQKFKC